MIGILTAIEEEFDALKKLLDNDSKETIATMPFVKGKVGNKDVVVAMSGQGKVNAACCCQILIDRYGADTVFNVGIAGSLSDSLGIGDVVISDKAAQYDFDASGEGLPFGQIPGMDSIYFKVDQDLLQAAQEAADDIELSYQVGGILTADLFLDSEQLKNVIKQRFEGIVCEMEGAAVAQVCFLNAIPFLIIRAVSDSASENANELAVKNAESSSNRTTDLVKNLIEKL